jgi:flavin-binding protein dodecin
MRIVARQAGLRAVCSARSIDSYQGSDTLVELALRGASPKRTPKEEVPMSMLKVIEVLAESDKSWEDAAQFAVDKANKSVRNVRSIWIDNFEATVDNGKIQKYRINAKISFVLEG